MQGGRRAGGGRREAAGGALEGRRGLPRCSNDRGSARSASAAAGCQAISERAGRTARCLVKPPRAEPLLLQTLFTCCGNGTRRERLRAVPLVCGVWPACYAPRCCPRPTLPSSHCSSTQHCRLPAFRAVAQSRASITGSGAHLQNSNGRLRAAPRSSAGGRCRRGGELPAADGGGGPLACLTDAAQGPRRRTRAEGAPTHPTLPAGARPQMHNLRQSAQTWQRPETERGRRVQRLPYQSLEGGGESGGGRRRRRAGQRAVQNRMLPQAGRPCQEAEAPAGASLAGNAICLSKLSCWACTMPMRPDSHAYNAPLEPAVPCRSWTVCS